MKKLLCLFLFSIPLLQIANAQQDDPFYKEDWKKVTFYVSKNLLRSAIAQIDTIYGKAKKAKNTPEVVKSLITLMSYEGSVNDSNTEAWIYRLQTEAQTASCPEKQLLHSLLAGIYWSYYEYNRYRFYNRTQTTNFKNDDVSTWDLTHVVDAALDNYEASLQNPDSLKGIVLEKYEVILVKGTGRELRPTLYDLLAHRALDFYKSEEPDITRPADQFALTDSAYLGDYEKFSKIDLKTTDTLSLKFYALQVFQKLMLTLKGSGIYIPRLLPCIIRTVFIYIPWSV